MWDNEGYFTVLLLLLEEGPDNLSDASFLMTYAVISDSW